MSAPRVVVTGGSGFVGQVIRLGLEESGYVVDNFDRWRGPIVDLVRRRYFAREGLPVPAAADRLVRRVQVRGEGRLRLMGLIHPTEDDILDMRSRLAARFAGAYALVHLAAIPHPFAPSAVDEDFQRINYDGAVNVYEAARDAGVAKFIYASSAQVYRINAPVLIEQFPVLETNHCPSREEGQTAYGFLKRQFECYLEKRAGEDGSGTQAISLRLEFPGFHSAEPNNLYVSTSIENTVGAFIAALSAPETFAAESFNICDPEVDRGIVDIQAYLRENWPGVPNFTRGNESLLSTAKIRDALGFRPSTRRTYIRRNLV